MHIWCEKMDKIDEKIIVKLRNNSRESFINIANQLKISEGTVRNRIKNLLDGGIIKKFTIKTTTKNIKSIISIKIDVNINTAEISSKISDWNGVETVYEVSGENDIIVIIDVTSISELNDIIEKIRQIEHVKSTTSMLILKEN